MRMAISMLVATCANCAFFGNHLVINHFPVTCANCAFPGSHLVIPVYTRQHVLSFSTYAVGFLCWSISK